MHKENREFWVSFGGDFFFHFFSSFKLLNPFYNIIKIIN